MRRAFRGAAGFLALCLPACGSSSTGPSDLPSLPVLQSPVGGTQVTTDSPTFTVRNAKGYDAGEANYAFRVAITPTNREIATLTVPAGSGTTSATFPTPLLRGALLSWRVTATSSAGQASSDTATFRLPPVACLSGRDPYAKRVVDWWIPACSLAQNHYNDPNQCLGPPDAGGFGPDSYFGFMSLGFGGYVSVDMEGCAVDGPGDDLRVYQSVSGEPITLYASGSLGGPWVLVESRKFCGRRTAGIFSNHCDFDLGLAGIEEARYFKVEDGELYPCPGDTVTEGADFDAIEIRNQTP